MASKGRTVEDVVGALRNEEAAKLVAQRDAQTARHRVSQLEVGQLLWLVSVSPCFVCVCLNGLEPHAESGAPRFSPPSVLDLIAAFPSWCQWRHGIIATIGTSDQSCLIGQSL